MQTPQTQVLGSNISYTSNGTAAVGTTLISDLDQYTGTLSSGTITFSGYKPDGTALGSSPTANLAMPITATTTLNDVLSWLNTDEGTAAVDEIQTISSTATGGAFTLSFGGQTTVDLNFNATAAEIEAELEVKN